MINYIMKKIKYHSGRKDMKIPLNFDRIKN